MSIYKSIKPNSNTLVSIWCIDESLEELFAGLELTQASLNRVDSMKSEIHQKGFLSVRYLLKNFGYTDTDLFYDEYGKPYLKDGKFISITHSFNFTAIIISDKTPVGIDIEKKRDKIQRIAHKFTPIQEYRTIANHDALIRKLTIVWGGKESLYKVYGKKKLLFLHHIYIDDFRLNDHETCGEIRYQGYISRHKIHFIEFEGFVCVYAF